MIINRNKPHHYTLHNIEYSDDDDDDDDDDDGFFNFIYFIYMLKYAKNKIYNYVISISIAPSMGEKTEESVLISS